MLATAIFLYFVVNAGLAAIFDDPLAWPNGWGNLNVTECRIVSVVVLFFLGLPILIFAHIDGMIRRQRAKRRRML